MQIAWFEGDHWYLECILQIDSHVTSEQWLFSETRNSINLEPNMSDKPDPGRSFEYSRSIIAALVNNKTKLQISIWNGFELIASELHHQAIGSR